jgi:large subunit ribosomal protein L6
MSRIGKKPIEVPAGVTVRVEGTRVLAKGKVGELALDLPPGIGARVEGGKVQVTAPEGSATHGNLHGLARSLVNNMLLGVTSGYRKDLTISGTGFKAAMQGTALSLSLGYSHPILYPVPAGIKIAVEENGTAISITGADKQLVGDVAARLRSFFPAEPYKGKGVQYKGERIRRKVGKTVA